MMLLIGSFFVSWSFAVLPFWDLLLSVYILIDNLVGDVSNAAKVDEHDIH